MYGIHILLPDNLEIDQQAPTTPGIPTALVTVRILGVWTLWAFEPTWLGTGTKDRHVKIECNGTRWIWGTGSTSKGLMLQCTWHGREVRGIVTVVSRLSHGCSWRLDDLGYPHDSFSMIPRPWPKSPQFQSRQSRHSLLALNICLSILVFRRNRSQFAKQWRMTDDTYMMSQAWWSNLKKCLTWGCQASRITSPTINHIQQFTRNRLYKHPDTIPQRCCWVLRLPHD